MKDRDCVSTVALQSTEVLSCVHLGPPAASGCGENLYMSSNKRSWSDVTQSWYNEVKDWRYGVGSVNSGVVGHLTQVRAGGGHVTLRDLERWLQPAAVSVVLASGGVVQVQPGGLCCDLLPQLLLQVLLGLPLLPSVSPSRP